MSADPEAIIYYGFPIVEFEDDDYTYHDKNDEWTNARRPSQPEDKSDYRTPEWDEWREKLREWEKTPEHVEIEWSGAEDCKTYYVHARGLRLMVEWGEQAPLEGRDFGPRPEADEYIKAFCDQFGIELQKCGWHLAVRYF